METEDVDDAVAAILHCWGSEGEYTDDELFARARLQWSDSRSSDAARDFVLMVVACRLEEQFLMWLLQSHAADATEDIQTLFEVSTDPYFTVQGLELVKPVLEALLCVAVVRAASSERSGETRKRRMAEVMRTMEGTALVNSRACSALRSLQKCEVDEDGDNWTQFLALPHALEPRLFSSRSGRAFMDGAGQVIAFQQTELAGLQRKLAESGGVDLEGEEHTTIATALWRVAMQLMELIKTKFASSNDVQVEDKARGECSLVAVNDMASLEEYLKTKAPLPPSTNDSPCHESDFEDDDVELSAMEQLSSICRSTAEELSLSSELLANVFNELSAVKSLEVVSIQTSFFLGLQMCHKLCFLDCSETPKGKFERRIRRVFNRLTGKSRDLEHVASLAVLAAFCPSQIIRHCVRGARTDVLHHGLYLEVFRASPLLLEWNGEREEGRGSLFERELQQTLLDVPSNQSSFDKESQNLVLFIISLTGISSSPPFQRTTPVMAATKLIDCVLNPLLCCAEQPSEIHFKLYSLVQQVFQQFVTASMGQEIDPVVSERSLNLVLSSLSSENAIEPVLGVLVRERLLLLLKNTMELMPDPASQVTLEQLDMPVNPQLWTLMGLFNSDLGNDEFCKGLDDVAAVASYVQRETPFNFLAPLPLPNVISAVQVLLWGLLWDSTLSTTVSVKATRAETWKLVDAIAGYEFSGSDSTEENIKGSLLIQSAVAEMMLECGIALFQALLNNVIPYVLEYEPTASEEDMLKIPEWAPKLVDEAEMRLQIPCPLVSTHAIMGYVVKCWSLSGAVNIQLAAPPNPLLVASLSHVLGAYDTAITSSKRSLSGTLFCLQWLCLLVSASCELHLDSISSWPSARIQLELSLLRLLHQLDQMKGISTEEAHFSQRFVAALLAYLPAGQFDQVFNFIASRMGK